MRRMRAPLPRPDSDPEKTKDSIAGMLCLPVLCHGVSGKNAIQFSLPPARSSFRHALPGMVIAVLFVTGIAAARLSGNWHNRIPKEAYLAHVTRSPSVPIGGHPEIDVEKIKKNDSGFEGKTHSNGTVH